jgi:hypothetical protein
LFLEYHAEFFLPLSRIASGHRKKENPLRRVLRPFPAFHCCGSGRHFLDLLDHLIHHLLRPPVQHVRVVGVEERVLDT